MELQNGNEHLMMLFLNSNVITEEEKYNRRS